jgi:hypothetical protein
VHCQTPQFRKLGLTLSSPANLTVHLVC